MSTIHIWCIMCRFKGLDYYYHSEIHLSPLKISKLQKKSDPTFWSDEWNPSYNRRHCFKNQIQSIANNFDKTVLTPIYIFFILSNLLQDMEKVYVQFDVLTLITIF